MTRALPIKLIFILLLSLLSHPIDARATCAQLFAHSLKPAADGIFEQGRREYTDAAAYDQYVTIPQVAYGIKNQIQRDGNKVMIHWMAYTVNVNGESQMAYFYYRYLVREKIVVADLMEMPDSLKGMGISKYFFATMLKKHPNTKAIYGMLGHDNRVVYLNNERSREENLRSTPFMKAIKHFGFTEILFNKLHTKNMTSPTPEVLIARPIAQH